MPILWRCLGAVLASAALAGAAAAEPLAEISNPERIPSEALVEGVRAAIGEAEGPATARWRARARAREAAERAERYFRAEAYYGVRVDPFLEEDPLAPFVRIRPGKINRFSEITIIFSNAKSTPEGPIEAAREALALEIGETARAEMILAAQARVVNALRNNGWPDARAERPSLVVDHARQEVDAQFRFDPGEPQRFGPPQFAGGAAQLRPDYIARLAPYEIGDPVSVAAINAYTERLQNLEGIALAEARLADYAEEGLTPVDVRAEPAATYRLGVGASYSTSEGFGAEADWTKRNLFQGDETLTLAGRAAEIDSALSADLRFPNWRRYNQDLDLNAEVRAERTDAFDQDSLQVSAAVSRVFSPTWLGSVSAEGQVASVTDAFGERTLYTLSGEVGAVYDRRNSALDPTSGFYGDLRGRPGLSLGEGTQAFVRLIGEGRAYRELTQGSVLAVRVRAGSLLGANPQTVPADARFFAGGGGSVRGFEFQGLSPRTPGEDGEVGEPFGGTSLFEASLEYRWRFRDNLGFVGFVDTGTAGEDREPDLSDLRTGLGAGVRYYPGFGPIRFDIATPLDRRDGEDPIQIYISIGQAF